PGHKYLAHGCIRVAIVCGAIEVIGSVVDRVGTSRAHGQWSVKQDCVGASDAVGGEVAETTNEVPINVAGRYSGRRRNVRISNLIMALVEVGVVHGDVRGVRGVLVDRGKATIAAVGPGPSTVWLHELRAVVLRAADGVLGIRGVHGEAFKLRGRKTGIVETVPRHSTIIRTKDSAIVSGVYD